MICTVSIYNIDKNLTDKVIYKLICSFRVDETNEPDFSITSMPLEKELKAFLSSKLYLIQMKELNKALMYPIIYKKEEMVKTLISTKFGL